MGKITLFVCDLTKEKCDPEKVVKITFKIDGKNRVYTISEDSALKLERQLISNNALPKDWSFSRPTSKPSRELDEDDDEPMSKEEYVTRIRASRDLTPKSDQTVNVTDCLHYNKGKVQFDHTTGNVIPYQICKNCNAKLYKDKKESVAE